MSDIRVLLCDDHTLFRNGIVSLLKDQPGIYVLGEAMDGNELIKKYNELLPDVVVTDISMPEKTGIEAVQILKSKYPNIRVLFLTMMLGEEFIYSCIKVGGMGLLSKTVERGELYYAISEVFKGRNYFGPQYNEEKIKVIMKRYENTPLIDFNIKDEVTEAEGRILFFISEGLSSDEISEALCISRKTVDAHRSKLMKKLNLSSSAALIRYAVKYVVLKPK